MRHWSYKLLTSILLSLFAVLSASGSFAKGITIPSDLLKEIQKQDPKYCFVSLSEEKIFTSFLNNNVDPEIYNYYKKSNKNMHKVEKILHSFNYKNNIAEYTIHKFTGDTYSIYFYVDLKNERKYLCISGLEKTPNEDILFTEKHKYILPEDRSCSAISGEFYNERGDIFALFQ